MRLFIQLMNVTSSSLDKTLFKIVNDCGIIVVKYLVAKHGIIQNATIVLELKC